MIKRIYAIVSDKEFYAFRRAAYAQDMTFGEALTKLVVSFGKGEIPIMQQKESKKKTVTNTYLKDHKGETVSKAELQRK